MFPVSRRWLLRSGLAVVVAALLAPAVASAVPGGSAAAGGVVESPASTETIVSVQGVRFGPEDGPSPARLFAADENGTVTWEYNGAQRGFRWLYDVDPLPNGNLLVTATVPGDTVVFELDPATKERVWTQRLDAKDTHDVDLINGDQLLVGNMRNFNETTGVSHDRVFVYDLSRDEIVWEWEFRNHYPRNVSGGHGVEWTHLNDVDKVGDGLYLASPRDFDQVILINRSTKAIEWRLGSDGNTSVLHRQHNPDFLRGPNGNPTLLVSDSENNRVVEYARVDGEWERTWAVTGFHWPRDADRLPNGNTLVTDTKNDRVVEITPTGEVVWEVSAKWGTYEAERGRDGSQGPTMREHGVTGTYRVHGGALGNESGSVGTLATVEAVAAGTPLGGPVAAATGWLRAVEARFAPPWLRGSAFLALAAGAVVALGWVAGEVAYRRRRAA